MRDGAKRCIFACDEVGRRTSLRDDTRSGTAPEGASRAAMPVLQALGQAGCRIQQFEKQGWQKQVRNLGALCGMGFRGGATCKDDLGGGGWNFRGAVHASAICGLWASREGHVQSSVVACVEGG